MVSSSVFCPRSVSGSALLLPENEAVTETARDPRDAIFSDGSDLDECRQPDSENNQKHEDSMTFGSESPSLTTWKGLICV